MSANDYLRQKQLCTQYPSDSRRQVQE
jgi:hypothetical protein